jgi:DNA-binding NarL/FixJ family response regulator
LTPYHRAPRRLVARFTASLAPTETHSHATQLASLTPREKEVFVLVATGYSNTEIASQLYIGDESVKTHVSRILSKLGLRDRVHAVVYAHHHGLVNLCATGIHRLGILTGGA